MTEWNMTNTPATTGANGDVYRPKVGHEVINYGFISKVVKLIGDDSVETTVKVTGQNLDIIVSNVDLEYIPRHRA